MLADVNGDGKVGVIGFGYAGVYVALAQQQMIAASLLQS
jgi:hypothetical protein